MTDTRDPVPVPGRIRAQKASLVSPLSIGSFVVTWLSRFANLRHSYPVL